MMIAEIAHPSAGGIIQMHCSTAGNHENILYANSARRRMM
jgi:hypothetical protein